MNAALQQYDRFTARFEPVRRDDLQPGVAEWIGRTLRWSVGWEIEPGYQYAGEWHCVVEVERDEPGYPPPFVWAPDSDLQDIVVTRRYSFGKRA